MKALPLEQAHLLELQALDLAIAKANHQLRSHPLHATLAQLQGRGDDLRVARLAFEADLSVKNRQIQGLEAEVEKVKARKILQQERLDQGKVPLRDISALQHEINQIGVRIDTLEGELLEAMGEAENIEAKIAAAGASGMAIDEELKATQASLNEAAGDVGKELADLQSRRTALVDLIPEAVVTRYTALQRSLGVSVVIEVNDGRVVSSPVPVSMAEVAEILAHPQDQIYFTDDDEYMVVRTTSA